MKLKYTTKGLALRLLGAMALVIGMASCESYLDVDRYFYDKTTIDSVFMSKVRVNEYINGTAALLPDESMLFTLSTFPFGLATDECFSSWEDARHAGMYFLLGNETPQNVHFDNWAKFYKGIRKANIVLTRISECKDLTDMERRDYTGRAYFLRAYFYFCLLRQYGPVPILPDQAFDVDASADEVSKERNTYDECVDYICSNMSQAATLLPTEREQVFQYVPTQGAALAVISRMRLYSASLWYNGNTRYADWKTTDGKHFISQVKDNSRWGIAAAAAKRVIDLGQYALYTTSRTQFTLRLPSTVSSSAFPLGAGDIDPYLSYKEMFDGTVPATMNPELIYYCNAIIKGNSPQWIGTPYVLGGGNGMNVCMDLVDSYRMIDGYDIHHSSANYPYPDTEHAGDAIGQGYTFSGNYPVSANMARIDNNREPRYYATLGYNHCIWPGTSYVGTDNVTNVEITYYADGTGAPAPAFQNDYCRTGYTIRKFTHQEDNLKGSTRAKTFAVFRYAEILLNYVEAMNEMTGSYTDEASGITVTRNTEEMKKYFNMVRFRSGMPGITDAELSSVEKMQEAIRLERKIEFALEGYRYHDTRRWGIAAEVYNVPIIGFNTKAKKNERAKYFTRTIWDSENIEKRVFLQKNYFFPIPQTVMNKNERLVQNPGW